jgi:hypothetical protein
MTQQLAGRNQMHQAIGTLRSLEGIYQSWSRYPNQTEAAYKAVFVPLDRVRECLGQLKGIPWEKELELQTAYASGMTVLKMAFDADIARRRLLITRNL